MPRQRKRENQKHFDAGFKACQIASQKVIKAKDQAMRDLENLYNSVLEKTRNLEHQLNRRYSDLVATENLMEQYGERIQIIKRVLDLPVSTVSYEQVNGKSNDNDRCPTRSNR